MKSMYLDNVVNFPFPTPPDGGHIRAAERKLITLGALQAPPKNLSLKEMEAATRKAKITRLGRAVATFPLAPRFGKMLALSHQHGMSSSFKAGFFGGTLWKKTQSKKRII